MDVDASNLPENFSLYIPFTRVSTDEDKREIVGVATKEVLDSHGTIISYEASKKAFARWAGNIREQHDPKKAVGKAVQWTPDDENKQIFVRAYISKGAQDTWEKIKDGTLTGFSIAGVNAKYKTIQRDNASVPLIDEYDMPELSIVDNPSCPVGPVALVRADGMTADALATDEEVDQALQAPAPPEPTPTPEPQPSEIERAGARISSESRDTLHSMRDQAMSLCGCDDCKSMMQPDDGDGDVDTIDRVTRAVDAAMSPVYARMQALAGSFARNNTDITTFSASLLSAFERVAAKVETLAAAASLDEVRKEITSVQGDLTTVKGQIERIASTPLPGGPHTGRGANKTLATDGPARPEQEQTPDILRDLANRGVELSTAQRTQLVATSLKRLY